MNKKTLYIVVAVIIIVLVVAVAGVMLLNNGGNGGTPTTTPTPTPAATIVGANTLQFSVNDSSAGLLFTYSSKNFNTSTEIVRVDMNIGAAGNYSYIIDMGTQKAWASTDAGVTWTESTDFAADVTNYATPFYTYVGAIADRGNIDDFAYSSLIQISCITVNPTLADSFFTAG